MTGTILTKAQTQYFTRPDDERFASVEALNAFCRREDDESHEERAVPRGLLPVEAGPGGVVTIGGAALTNWSFSQACNLAKFPAAGASSLCKWGRSDMAAEAIALGFQNTDPDKPAAPYLRLHEGGGATMRALVSKRYTRVLNSTLTGGLLKLQERKGWVVPPAWGDKPSGLYASDRDMFVYMIDDEARSIVKDPEAMNRPPEDLGRGFFLWNSEVGAKSFGLCLFWFNWTCGNHLVMGARYVREIKVRHVGRIQHKIQRALEVTGRLAADTGTRDNELGRMRAAMAERLCQNEKDLVPVLARRTGLGTKALEAAVEIGAKEGSNPIFAWGAVQGITALARDTVNADTADTLRRGARVLLDADGGKALPAYTVR